QKQQPIALLIVCSELLEYFLFCERISIAHFVLSVNVLHMTQTQRNNASLLHSKGDRIRILNDHLRKTFTGGRVLITRSIAELDQRLRARVLLTVRDYDEFDAANDPYHEHDLAFFELERERYFFKIDYFDLNA